MPCSKSLLKLPLLPTTTIGSLPQTKELRELRARFKKGEIDQATYEKVLEDKTAEAMRWQDEIGIDVPVHGEFERNDMVEYFGEQLNGFAFTERAWVQSYGSRCVKPPIIFGDVSRARAHDGALDADGPELHRQTGERHADRSGDHPAMELCARRPAARPKPAGRSRWRSATK